jgi:hypothetical protein
VLEEGLATEALDKAKSMLKILQARENKTLELCSLQVRAARTVLPSLCIWLCD